ncbi:hypothetical protein LTR36_001003 [Oleoguttula mirabilis]|uniref:Phosphatidic acid phosphatase type 2/haloperoxidase domain-containing protein n=1 Tax=Oleoguttula mirabilis TaxID=1507867 RepID=A0AAV9JP46_9PEZI|nr:hypothetical protein LTR36_001003 [Oleoguttula mirabilis]
MAPKSSRPSVRLILSYVLDWIIIIAVAAAGGGLNSVTPNHRPFSLLDLDISFPLVTESISTITLVIVSLVAPAVIIFLVVAILVPGRNVTRNMNRSQVLRMKLWEFEKGWAGLALAVATAFFITQGAKNLFGKPRPDLLARCQPDLANIAAHVVGGYGQDISPRWVLVRSSICKNTDTSVVNDGFRSYPSGHSSFSWSGLLYLTLFLCSKFSIGIPYLPREPTASDSKSAPSQARAVLPLHVRDSGEETAKDDNDDGANILEGTSPSASSQPISIRTLAASPPVYLIVPAFLPIAVAVYISSTRYAQFYHHGFDILSGSLIGILTAWFAFRWYHLPLSRGQGWAWGSRSQSRAFGIGVGTGGYKEERGWNERGTRMSDLGTNRSRV